MSKVLPFTIGISQVTHDRLELARLSVFNFAGVLVGDDELLEFLACYFLACEPSSDSDNN